MKRAAAVIGAAMLVSIASFIAAQEEKPKPQRITLEIAGSV